MKNSNKNTPSVGSLIKVKEEDRRPAQAKINSNNLTVLDEEVYTSAIDHIIERDFFPDLKFLKQRNEESMDFGSIQKARFNESNIKPEDLVNTDAAPGLNLNLDRFFNKFTSEDNASFTEIIKKDNELKRQKYSWMYKDEDKNLIEGREEMRMITNESETTNEQRLIHISNAQKQLVPPRKELEDFKKDEDSNKREYKKIETWKFKAKNTLMFHPEGQPFKEPTSELYLRSKPKAIIHQNTRLPVNINNETAPSTPSTTLSHLEPFKKMGKFYDLVEATPEHNPDTLGDNNPLTWGFIESTPMALNETPSRTPRRNFELQEPGKREALSIHLTQKARKALHQRKLDMSPYSRNKDKHGLSPAANRLLQSTIKNKNILPSNLRNSFTLKSSKSTVSTPNFSNLISKKKDKE